MTILDADVHTWAKNVSWHVCSYGYAAHSEYVGGGRLDRKSKTIRLHKLILPDVKRIDHKNGNKLDNRRCNLRPAAHNQNMWNRNLDHDNTSGFKGASFRRDKAKMGHSCHWQARIVVDRRIVFLGYHKTASDAALAYDAAARTYFGAFARLNFPKRGEQRATVSKYHRASGD